MGMSNCCKICIGISICMAVIGAIMIPVGLLVIAPAIGQHAVDSSTLYITASITHVSQDDVPAHPWGMIQNNITAHNDVPLSAKLGECEIFMYIPTNSGLPQAWSPSGSYTINGTLSTFTMPDETMGASGNTTFDPFTSNMTINQPTAFAFFALGVIMGEIQVHILAKPKLTALGFVSMTVELGKVLNCTSPMSYREEYFPALKDIEDVSEAHEYITARRLSTDYPVMPPVPLKCVQMGNVKDLTDGDSEMDQVLV